MDDHPLAVTSNGDGDRLHLGAALRVPIAGNVVVDVAAPQAVWAMVSMSSAGRVDRYVETAPGTPERRRD
jgi:hypothetical protein